MEKCDTPADLEAIQAIAVLRFVINKIGNLDKHTLRRVTDYYHFTISDGSSVAKRMILSSLEYRRYRDVSLKDIKAKEIADNITKCLDELDMPINNLSSWKNKETDKISLDAILSCWESLINHLHLDDAEHIEIEKNSMIQDNQ